MKELFAGMMDFHPFWGPVAALAVGMWMLLMALAVSVLAARFSMAVLAILRENALERRSAGQGASSAGQGQDAVVVIGRVALVVALAVVFFLLPSGCGTFGNGKIDPGGVVLLDLSQLQVGLRFVGQDGTPYTVTRTGSGAIDVQAEFQDPHGNVYTLGEGVGNLSIRNPETGLQLTISPKLDTVSNLR